MVFVITRQRKNHALIRTSFRHAFRLPCSSSWSAFSVQAMPLEAWPAQTPPLVWLACWLGNRPADRSRELAAGRPFGTSPGRVCLTLATASQEKNRAEVGRIIPPHMEAICLIGGYLPKPPNPFGSFTCRMQAAQIHPLPTLTSSPKTLAFSGLKY